MPGCPGPVGLFNEKESMRALSLIFILGLATSELCRKVKIPGIIGMLVTGMEWAYRRDHLIRNSVKVILISAFAFLLLVVEEALEGVIAVSGLLPVVSMALMIRNRSEKMVADRLSEKFGKLWLAVEPVLFVLVGAAVDIRYTFAAGLPGLL